MGTRYRLIDINRFNILCCFTEKLQNEYPLIKKIKFNDYDVYCRIYLSSFSVSHDDKTDIVDHIKTKKHKNANTAAFTSYHVTHFFTPLKTKNECSKLTTK